MDQVALARLEVINWRFGGGKGFEKRDAIGSDELASLVKNDDGSYSVLSPNKDYWLTVNNEGNLEERTSSNPPGDWEKFHLDGNVLIEMPKEGVTRPVKKFIPLQD
jgi:hypothetical protein